MFDASFFAALAIIMAGLVVLVVEKVLLPLRKTHALERELQALGVSIGPRGGGEPVSFREWALPVQVSGVLETLQQQLATTPGWEPSRLEAGTLRIQGRRLRFLNVNRVRPNDFRQAEFRVHSASPNILVTRADFGGYWRTIAVVLLFTAWGGFIVWLSSRRLVSFKAVLTVLLVFAAVFLAVHYYSQQLKTRNFFDEQVIKAVRRATKTPSRAA